jgi:phthalate 4,5-dioxygenase oxygenase subunit
MLSKEDNELITRVGPGTPLGELFRRYWLPALLSNELPEPDCPPVKLRLLGEDLIAFRVTSGNRSCCPARRSCQARARRITSSPRQCRSTTRT